MSSIVALTSELYREEVARARAMNPEDKLLEGPRLFDRACHVMADGIRHQHPELNEPGVRAQLSAPSHRTFTGFHVRRATQTSWSNRRAAGLLEQIRSSIPTD